MKKIFFLFTSLWLSADAQQPIYFSSFSGTGNIHFYNSVQLPDKEFMIAGVSYDFAADTSAALIMKIDSNLNMLWCRQYKYMRYDDLYTMNLLSDGKILAGGTGRQDFATIVGASLIKMDKDGIVEWSKVYSHSYDDRVWKVYEEADNSLMVFVRMGVSGYPTEVLHLNSSGDIISQFILKKGNKNLFADGIASDNNRRYYLTGGISDDSYKQVIFVAALNGTAVDWYKEIDLGRPSQSSKGISILKDGSICVSAQVTDSINSPANDNSILIRMSADGAVRWIKEITIDGTTNEYIAGNQSAADGNVFIFGSIGSSSNTAILCKVDTNGNFLFTKEYKTAANTFSVANCDEMTDGRLLLKGIYESFWKGYLAIAGGDGSLPCKSGPVTIKTNTPSFTVTSPSITPEENKAKAEDVMITSWDFHPVLQSVCTGVWDSQPAIEPVEVVLYPNPATNHLTVTAGEEGTWTIQDLLGRTVLLNTTPIHSTPTQIDISRLPPGLYVLKVKTQSGSRVTKFVKQ